MTDFTAIADAAVAVIGSADPAQFQTAYDAMTAETHQVSLTENRKTELALMSELGITTANTILTKIEDYLNANGMSRVVRMIQSTEGINLADPETVALIGALVAGGVLAQGESDALLASNTETQPKWPGLTTGQVSDALNMRARGDI